MSQPPFDLARAHRWFAVECNNEAWDVVESDSPSADDLERLIHVAHASVHHWSRVGEPINRQRGLSLLVSAYVAAGQAEPAVHYARRCLAMSEAAGDVQTPFDRATALGGMAIACALAGRNDEAVTYHGRMTDRLANLDAEERAVVERLYPAPT